MLKKSEIIRNNELKKSIKNIKVKFKKDLQYYYHFITFPATHNSHMNIFSYPSVLWIPFLTIQLSGGPMEIFIKRANVCLGKPS